MPITTLPAAQYLPLDDGHRMAWFECGPAQPAAGLAPPPVLVLHGGPGGRSRAASLNWFDGLGLRCIAFDQRGCGDSTPAGACEHNTLARLVADIERLRMQLGLGCWAVVGGSWGSTLALAYAAAHPQRVAGLFLRSSFLASEAEVAHFFAPWSAWLGEAGAQALAGPLGLGAKDPVPGPVQLLQAVTAACSPVTGNALSPGEAQALVARIAAAWDDFEQAQSQPGGLLARPALRWAPRASGAAAAAAHTVPDGGAGDRDPLALALPSSLRVQQHYLAHHCFADDAQRAHWLRQLQALPAQCPVALVHGLQDAVCDPAISRQLLAWRPGATWHEVPGAGHAMDHPALAAALTQAAAQWVARLPGRCP